MRDHDGRVKEKDVTLTPKSKVPLYVVGSTILLTIVMTLQWADLRNRLDNSLTVQQAQDWIDQARDRNPTMNFPPIPPRRSMAYGLGTVAFQVSTNWP